jgi:hypothetical protein
LAEENPGMAAEAAEKIIFKQDEKAQKDDLYRRIAKGAIRKGHMTTAVLLLAEYTDFAPPEERVALMEEAITAGMEKEPYQAFRLATEHMATTNPGLRARALTAWIEKDSARNPNLILDDLEEPEEMTQLARHLYRNGLYLPARKAFVRAGYTGPESAECAKMLLTRGEIGDTEQKSLKITDEEYIAAAEGLAATNPYTAYLYLVDCRDNPKAKDALRNISEPLLLARRKDEAYFAQICSGNPIPETINKVRTILISERGARAIDTFEHHGDMEGIAMAYDTLCDQLSTGEKYRIAMKLSTRTEDKRWDATAQDLRSALVSTYVAGAIMLFRDYRDQKGLDLAAAELKRQVPALEGIEDLMRKTLLLTVPESTQKP